MKREINGWHVLAIILIFFGVTLAVNAVFVTYAVATFAGEDTEKPYLKGLAFNAELASRVRARELGWTVAIKLTRVEGGITQAVVQVRGADRAHVKPASVLLNLKHPADAKKDRAVELALTEDGSFGARLESISSGQWNVAVTLIDSGGQRVLVHQRVVLP